MRKSCMEGARVGWAALMTVSMKALKHLPYICCGEGYQTNTGAFGNDTSLAALKLQGWGPGFDSLNVQSFGFTDFPHFALQLKQLSAASAAIGNGLRFVLKSSKYFSLLPEPPLNVCQADRMPP